MDYFQLLNQAYQNTLELEENSKSARVYKTTFSVPKKPPKSRVSNQNVQKFLKKREEEDLMKKQEAERQKQSLLALRSQDKKATRRVQVMLKRTKSANKSVMADAVDDVDTVDTLAGSKQCDEDDYGYVSNEASAIYDKLIKKYENSTNASLFSTSKREVKDLSAAKDRVKAALKKEEEAEFAPRKRKTKNKDKGDEDESMDVESEELQNTDNMKSSANDSTNNSNRPTKPVVKKSMPAPMGFYDLLVLAEKKQHEPVVIPKSSNSDYLPGRPMTKKEKAEYEKERDRRRKVLISQGLSEEQIAQKLKNDIYVPRNSKNQKSKVVSSEFVNEPSEPVINKEKPDFKATSTLQTKHNNDKLNNKNLELSQSSKQGEKRMSSKPACFSNSDRPSKPTIKKPTPHPTGSGDLPSEKALKDSREVSKTPMVNYGSVSKLDVKGSDKVKTAFKNNMKKTKAEENSKEDNLNNSISDIEKQIEMLKRQKSLLMQKEQIKANQIKPESSVKPKPIPRVDKNPVCKEQLSKKSTPSLEIRQKQLQRQKLLALEQSKAKAKKRRIESDSEYDSELDDFIDDNEEDVDYSSAIKEIFQYDRSRFQDDDSDDGCMESSYAQQMKEEWRSAKIGLMEDLEDIEKEKQEKEAKMKRLKEKFKK